MDTALARHERHFFDLQFSVVAEVYSHRVDFKIYDMVAWADDTPSWSGGGSCFVGTLAEADVYLHGFVKWDGCSNWHFNEQDCGMLHGCSRENVQRFGDVLGRCWDWTAELLSNWDGD